VGLGEKNKIKKTKVIANAPIFILQLRNFSMRKNSGLANQHLSALCYSFFRFLLPLCH